MFYIFISMKGGLALAGIGVLALIILFSVIIVAIIDPASLLALGNQVSQIAYKATGGYIGTPPPPPPPVKFNVGEEVQWDNLSLGIGWTAQQPIGGGVFQYYGSCKVPTELYALNITNEANAPIMKIVIYLPKGLDTPAPLPHPWFTNETHYSAFWQGNATSWEIVKVYIHPHSTVVIWNASTIGQGLPIWFYFANGSVYETQIPWTPNYPT